MSTYNSNHQRNIDNQSEPEPLSSMLECPNDTGTWLAENMAETIQTAAIEIVGDYLAGPRDGYAEATMHREIMRLADRCEKEIRLHEEREAGSA